MGMVSERDYELLSSYVDNALDERERAALEARLRESEDLRRELAALYLTLALVKQLPTLTAPRSFELSPAQARTAAPERVQAAEKGRRWLVFPASYAFSFATAAAAAFCLVFGAVLFGGALAPAAAPNVALAPTPTNLPTVRPVGVQPVATVALFGSPAPSQDALGGQDLAGQQSGGAAPPMGGGGGGMGGQQPTPTMKGSDAAPAGNTMDTLQFAAPGTPTPLPTAEAAGATMMQPADAATPTPGRLIPPAMAQATAWALTAQAGSSRATTPDVVAQSASPTPGAVIAAVSTPIEGAVVPADDALDSPPRLSEGTARSLLLGAVLMASGGLLLVVAGMTAWVRWRSAF